MIFLKLCVTLPLIMRITILYFLLFVTLFNCANRGTPSGGPIDESPPIVISSKPENFSVNFTQNEIEIFFDEYIRLNNIQNELIISPPINPMPIIIPMSSAKKSIIISDIDSLKKNTTYSFNFGESIEDNNERNPLPNFKYVFSTGKYIDSLKLSGVVKDGYNKDISDKIHVLLYEYNSLFNDSIVYSSKPKYIDKVNDTTFSFTLENIKKGKYLVIALEEENKNYLYESKLDKIGFNEKIIELPNDSLVEIILFKEEAEFKIKTVKQNSQNSFKLGYDGIYEDFDINITDANNSVLKNKIIFDSKSDSLVCWLKNKKRVDSLTFKISGNKFSEIFNIKVRDKEKDSLIIKSNQINILKFYENFSISGNIPFESINIGKINVLDKDSISIDHSVRLDNLKNELILDFEKSEEQEYLIEFLPGAITDFYENVNDTLLYKLSTKSYNDYGNLKLNLKNTSGQNLIIQLLSINGEVKFENLMSNSFNTEFKNIEAGNYLIRIIFDTNNNNRYDSGNYLKKIQPEKVVFFPEEIEIRAGWDLVQEFILQ